MSVRFTMMPRIPAIEDPDLALLSSLIQFPLIGMMYRHRFQMVLDLCSLPVGKVLEIGYGAGFLAYVLAPSASEYVGIDLHAEGEAVRKALREMGVINARFLQRDARSMEGLPDDSFDLVVSVSCLEHIRDQHAVQREIARVLRPGGEAVFGLPVKNVLTSGFFRLVGYDHSAIHPSEPADVISAFLEGGFDPDRQTVFPRCAGLRMGLYWAGLFIKPIT